MLEFQKFLSQLGNLHDCTLLRFEWNSAETRVELEIEDLYSNFEGLPEYKGPTPGKIILEGVSSVGMDIEGLKGALKIYDASVTGTDKTTISISFWPSGKINLACQNVSLPPL